MAGDATRRVIMGRINGLFGVRGWVRLLSYTDPRENIIRYGPWYLRRSDGWQRIEVIEGRVHGKGVVARLAGICDRDAAAELVGSDIAVDRDALPASGGEEFYWVDLVGLRVITLEGEELGTVDHLIETGANDVLVVRGERERLVPYVKPQVIRAVDLEGGTITVDWDPEF